MKLNLNFFLLLISLLFSTQIVLGKNLLAANNDQVNFCAKIKSVIENKQATGINKIFLVLKHEDNKQDKYLIGSDSLLRFIEEDYKVILDDYLERNISQLKMMVCFKQVTTKTFQIESINYKLITQIGSIKTKSSPSNVFIDYSKLNPECPKADFYHRYLEVPINYQDQDSGKFKLYYEINSDFDENKPTIMIPTDAQRTSSQVGMADIYKKIFNIKDNVITYEYRGMFCSKIKQFEKKEIDWVKAYQSLHSDNAIEDIERIRLDFFGTNKMLILGGSGISMLGLKYLSKYHDKVDRAYLLSFFKDAKGGSYASLDYFKQFLKQKNLKNEYLKIIDHQIIPIRQFLFILQRILYSDENLAVELIKKTNEKNLSLFNHYTKEFGSIDYFIRSVQKYFPHIVVFMYETNVDTSQTNIPDINYSYYQIASLLHALEDQGKIPSERFDIYNLDKVQTEVLLIAGTLDQVAPLQEMEKIHQLLPNSKLAIFEAYHVLQVIPEARKARNDLIEIFFHSGSNSDLFFRYLREQGPLGRFLQLKY